MNIVCGEVTFGPHDWRMTLLRIRMFGVSIVKVINEAFCIRLFLSFNRFLKMIGGF
jgi:hypothetical protein